MIDGANGLEVRVRTYRNKKTCPEAKISNQSPLYTGDARHRMISATTNERFDVQVVLTDKFESKGHRYVRVKLDFDGGVRTTTKHILNNSIRHRGRSDGSFKYAFSTMKDQKNGEWTNFGFAFGALEIVEDLVLNAEQEAKQAANRGTIKVTVQRGWAVRTEEDAVAIKKPPGIPALKSSERVVVDHCKTHGFKRTLGGRVTPSLEQWTFTPARGDAGEPIVYIFTYFSRGKSSGSQIVKANKQLEGNKQVKAANEGSPAKNGINELYHDAVVPSKGTTNVSTKRTHELIDLCNDDEEELRKIMKVDSSEQRSCTTPAPLKDYHNTEAERTKARDDQGRDPRKLSATDRNSLAGVTASTGNQKEREREKEKIMLAMEENNLKLENYRLQRKLWELEK